MEATAGIGHNMPKLADRIFSDPDVSPSDVLEAVMEHVRKKHTDQIQALSNKAALLEANSKRLPGELTDEGAISAMELLCVIDGHCQEADAERSAVLDTASKMVSELTGFCKPMDAGLASLEKKLRPLLSDYLIKVLDDHNSSLDKNVPPMTSIAKRGPSGGRVSITDGWKTSITDPALIPRDLCVPDAKLIDAALAKDLPVAGVKRVRSPTLRIVASPKS